MSENRYTVRQIEGDGRFRVFDTKLGHPFAVPYLFRETAQKLADRLNVIERDERGSSDNGGD